MMLELLADETAERRVGKIFEHFHHRPCGVHGGMPIGTAIEREPVLVARFQATARLVKIRASLRLFVRSVDTREGERDELLRELQAPF